MAWREECESRQMERLWIPNRDLPNFPLRVRVCARRCRRCSKSLLNIAQWRRRCGRAVDTHALRRWRVGREIDRLFEKAVVSLAEESVKGIEAAHDRQGVHEEGRLIMSVSLVLIAAEHSLSWCTHEPCKPSTSSLSIDVSKHIVASS